MKKEYPGRPQRITPFQKLGNPIYFVTINTDRRRKILNHDWLHQAFVDYMELKADDGITCGRYVIMPDHLHFFLRIDSRRYRLGRTIGFIKQHLSCVLKAHGVAQTHWQKGFFDHIIRNSEQNALKNDYVLYNPVKAEFVQCPENWEYHGKIRDLVF